MFESTPAALSVLKHRNFTFYLVARFLATTAMQMQSVAVGWQVYDMTGSLLDLGLVGLAQFLPFLFLVLVGGHVADRFNRRAIIALCFCAQLVSALMLLLIVAYEIKDVQLLLATVTIIGAARAFIMPATQAVVANILPPRDLQAGIALTSSGFQLAVIVGPIISGLLYIVGPHVVYTSVAILLMTSITLMSLTKISQVISLEPASLRNIFDGFRFVRSRPVILGAISLDLFAVLFGGATALLPAFAKDVLQVSPAGLGALRMAPGIGAAITGVLLAIRPITRNGGPWMFFGVLVFGLSTIVLGFSTRFTVAFLALLGMGSGDMLSMYIRHILVQFETPDAIRGRVSAVNSVFIGASNELGEFESGLTAHWFGLVRAIVLGGVATLVVAGLWTALFPTLLRVDKLTGEDVKNARTT